MYVTSLQKKAFKKAAMTTNNQAIGALATALTHGNYPHSYLQELTYYLTLEHSSTPLTSHQLSKLQQVLFLLSQQTPVEYIVGRAIFFERYFEVNRHTLIPRFDTEALVSAALDYLGGLKNKSDLAIADIGTGSGVLAITMALETIQHTPPIIAIDDSPAALAVARRNAAKYGIEERIRFIECRDFPQERQVPIVPKTSRVLVLANPPYIQPKHFDMLPPSVTNFEPKHALFEQPNLLRNLLGYLDLLVTQEKQVAFFLEYNNAQGKMIQIFLPNYQDRTPLLHLL